MKACNKCGEVKMLPSFSRDKHKEDGYSTVCKECKREYRKSYYANHAEEARERARQWYKENKERHRQSRKQWIKRNRSRHLRARKEYFAQKYSSDPSYKLNHCARSFLARTLRALEQPKDFPTFEKMGYTANDLRQRIEMNFQPGMCWENHGEAWEIDHRVPMATMISRGETRVEVLNCLSNLMPLWKEKNRAKGARYAS